jgi:hypothetical protein
MAAVAVAAPSEAQIPAAFAVAGVAGVASSEEADVELRTEAEVHMAAVAVAGQRVEAQIPVEVAALVAAAALWAEAVAQIPAAVAEQEELRTDYNAAAVQVPVLLHWPRVRDPIVMRTCRSGSVQGFDR